MPALYFTVCQKIICKHLHTRTISVAEAAEVVQDLAKKAIGLLNELEADHKLREELERRTGETISDLAAIAAADWL